MKKSLFLWVLISGLAFSSCKNPAGDLTATQKADIEKQVLEQWDKLNLTLEKADAAGYLSFLSTDGFLGMHSEGTQFLTRESYADSVKAWFEPRKSCEMPNRKIKVHVLGENLALLDQAGIFQANFRDGRVIRLNHAVSFVFRKETSGWKIIHGHESWTGM
jgi:ketosteroid isomerase-like protein